jgi:hypothetical protein
MRSFASKMGLVGENYGFAIGKEIPGGAGDQ